MTRLTEAEKMLPEITHTCARDCQTQSPSLTPGSVWMQRCAAQCCTLLATRHKSNRLTEQQTVTKYTFHTSSWHLFSSSWPPDNGMTNMSSLEPIFDHRNPKINQRYLPAILVKATQLKTSSKQYQSCQVKKKNLWSTLKDLINGVDLM